MITSDANTIETLVARELESCTKELKVEYRNWFVKHRIIPRPILCTDDVGSTKSEEFWLLTDHTEDDDAPFRIIYCESIEQYGYECIMQNGANQLIGFYGTLLEILVDLHEG